MKLTICPSIVTRRDTRVFLCSYYTSITDPGVHLNDHYHRTLKQLTLTTADSRSNTQNQGRRRIFSTNRISLAVQVRNSELLVGKERIDKKNHDYSSSHLGSRD